MNRYLVLKQDDKYFVEQRNTNIYDPSNFTVVGSPTITDNGILSNCSNGNAVNTQVQLSQLAGKSWSIKGSAVLGEASHTLVKLSSVGNGNYIALGSVLWTASSKLIGFNCRTGTPENKSSDGTKISTSNNFANVGEKVYYTLSFDINTGIYSLYADKVDGTTLIGTWTATSSNKQLYYINMYPEQYVSLGSGSDGAGYLTTGSIDMKDFSVEVDGEEIFSGVKKAYYVLRR